MSVSMYGHKKSMDLQYHHYNTVAPRKLEAKKKKNIRI